MENTKMRQENVMSKARQRIGKKKDFMIKLQ